MNNVNNLFMNNVNNVQQFFSLLGCGLYENSFLWRASVTKFECLIKSSHSLLLTYNFNLISLIASLQYVRGNSLSQQIP